LVFYSKRISEVIGPKCTKLGGDIFTRVIDDSFNFRGPISVEVVLDRIFFGSGGATCMTFECR